MVLRFIYLAGVARAMEMRIAPGADAMVDLVTERIRHSISQAVEFKSEWKMDHLCDMLYYLQVKHNLWATTLRHKLKKAFEGFDDLLGHTVSWYIDELERRREELTTFGVHKTDQDMAGLLGWFYLS